MAVLVDNQADKIPHHGPALTSPIEANARAAQSDEGCDCARPAAVMGLARALIRKMWLIVALRWSLCVVAKPQNPSSPAHVASRHVRTRRRPGLASGGREVALHHHKVVAAAHIGTFVWPLSGCAQLGTAGTLGDRRPREAAVIGDRPNRPTPVVVASHGGEHARLGAEARRNAYSETMLRSTCWVGAYR